MSGSSTIVLLAEILSVLQEILQCLRQGSSTPAGRFVTTAEMAKVFGISQARLLELTRQGIIPGVEEGKGYKFFLPDAVAAFRRYAAEREQ